MRYGCAAIGRLGAFGRECVSITWKSATIGVLSVPKLRSTEFRFRGLSTKEHPVWAGKSAISGSVRGVSFALRAKHEAAKPGAKPTASTALARIAAQRVKSFVFNSGMGKPAVVNLGAERAESALHLSPGHLSALLGSWDSGSVTETLTFAFIMSVRARRSRNRRAWPHRSRRRSR